MANKFIDKLTFNNNTYDVRDSGARALISENSTNIANQSVAIAKNANNITAIMADNANIHSDLDAVTDRVATAETDIDNLETAVSKAQDDIVDNTDRINGHDTKIADLEDRMDSAEIEIKSLDDRTTANEDSITSLDSRVTATETMNTEQDAKIESIKETTAQHTQEIDGIKQDLAGVHEEINDLDDRITASTYEAGNGIYFGQGQEHTNINVDDEILDQINQNTIDITDLKDRMTDVEDDVTLIKSDIADVKGDIDDLQQDVDAIDGRVTINENDIADIKSKEYTKVTLSGTSSDGYKANMLIKGLKTSKPEVFEPGGTQRVVPTMASCAAVTAATHPLGVDLNDISDSLLNNNDYDGYVQIQLQAGLISNAPDDIGTIGLIANDSPVSTVDYNIVLLYNSYTGDDYNEAIVGTPTSGAMSVKRAIRYQQLTDLTNGKMYTRSYLTSQNAVVDGVHQPIGWTEWTAQSTDTTAIEQSIADLETKSIPSGGSAHSKLIKSTNADYDFAWQPDVNDLWTSANVNNYVYPGDINYSCMIYNDTFSTVSWPILAELTPFTELRRFETFVVVQTVYADKIIRHVRLYSDNNVSDPVMYSEFVWTTGSGGWHVTHLDVNRSSIGTFTSTGQGQLSFTADTANIQNRILNAGVHGDGSTAQLDAYYGFTGGSEYNDHFIKLYFTNTGYVAMGTIYNYYNTNLHAVRVKIVYTHATKTAVLTATEVT